MIGEAEAQLPAAKLSLAAILDDKAFETQVLLLSGDQSEQDLDDRVLRDAHNAGIEWQSAPPAESRAPSLSTVYSPSTASPSPPRRSVSIDSHQTCSTGLTSAYSRPSVDNSQISLSRSIISSRRFFSKLAPQLPLSASTTTTIDSRNQSTSSLTTASNRSSFSLDSDSSPRKKSTLKRGLNKLSRFRKTHADDSDHWYVLGHLGMTVQH